MNAGIGRVGRARRHARAPERRPARRRSRSCRARSASSAPPPSMGLRHARRRRGPLPRRRAARDATRARPRGSCARRRRSTSRRGRDRRGARPRRRRPTPPPDAADRPPAAGHGRAAPAAAARRRRPPGRRRRSRSRPQPARRTTAAAAAQQPQAQAAPPGRRGSRARAGAVAGGADPAAHRPPLRRLPRPPRASPALRAMWLGTVKGAHAAQRRGDPAGRRACDVPARRGAIVDRRGVELAVTEPADDVSRDAVPRQGPGRGRPRRSRRCSASPRTRCSRSSPRRDTGFVYLARSAARRKRSREIQKLKIPGLAFDARPTAASTRASGWPRRCSARSAPTARACRAWSTRRTTLLRGRDGKRRIVRDALGEPISVRDPEPAEPGRAARR